MKINNLVFIVIYDILQLCNKQNKPKKTVQQQTVQQQTVHKGLIVKY
jgi:hypothetical protein